MRPDPLPTAEELEKPPALAVLALTLHALDLIEAQFLAEYPELRCSGAPASSLAAQDTFSTWLTNLAERSGAIAKRSSSTNLLSTHSTSDGPATRANHRNPASQNHLEPDGSRISAGINGTRQI